MKICAFANPEMGWQEEKEKNMDKEIKALAKVFKIIPRSKGRYYPIYEQIGHGFLLLDEDQSPVVELSEKTLDILTTLYDKSITFNTTLFQKGWKEGLTDEEKFIKQILHYFAPYTFTPQAEIAVPGFSSPIAVITVMPIESIIRRLNGYFETTTAPSEHVMADLKDLVPLLSIRAEEIASFELKVFSYDYYGALPTDPQEFLRFLIYKTTGSTLIIKNDRTIEAIKSAAASSYNLEKAILRYIKEYPLEDLATIFYRFKPLFLAFKKFRGVAPYINTVRRLAPKYNKPLPRVRVENYAHLSEAEQEYLRAKMKTKDIIGLINYYYARYANEGAFMAPNVYTVRNGRIFLDLKLRKPLNNAQSAVHKLEEELVRRISPKVKGKTFYIPDYISYAMPVSGKQMLGNIPFRSTITIPEDTGFTAGISWKDKIGQRTDLDLHLTGADTHYGWNAQKSDGDSIIFSGDVVVAPDGATEAYWFSSSKKANETILGNYVYSSHDPIEELEFDFFLTAEPKKNRDVTYSPEKAIMPLIKLKFINGQRTQSLGMFMGNRFVFFGGSLEDAPVPMKDKENYIDALKKTFKSTVSVREVIQLSGGKVIGTKEYTALYKKERESVISFAPEDLSPNTLFDLYTDIEK
ncbi:hypothetical protein [Massilibacteroides sp.]|uniref:hypothetical protein n=1 Tax=Massilibacteroides sp. TaxID=2034766 RepID=UPI0026247B41|nr:hypothetical protein [Massilibacteroides sp.]MDD4516572.1 hypothetical protein [Massilibacteroides sp.]